MKGQPGYEKNILARKDFKNSKKLFSGSNLVSVSLQKYCTTEFKLQFNTYIRTKTSSLYI